MAPGLDRIHMPPSSTLIPAMTREEHAAYIQSWLKVLQNDKRFSFHAAALAQKAVEFVKGLQAEASSDAVAVRPPVRTEPKP